MGTDWELWDASTWQWLPGWRDHEHLDGLIIRQDGVILVAKDEPDGLTIRELLTGKEVVCIPQTVEAGRSFSADGTLMLAAIGAKMRPPGAVRIWDLKTGKVRAVLPVIMTINDDHGVFSPDGGVVAVWSAEEKRVRLFDTGSGKLLIEMGDAPMVQPSGRSKDQRQSSYPYYAWPMRTPWKPCRIVYSRDGNVLYAFGDISERANRQGTFCEARHA